MALGACGLYAPGAAAASPTAPTARAAPLATPTPGVRAIPAPANHVGWQIQYSGPLEIDLQVDVFNLDLFETPIPIIEELHRRGVFVICYFSAGSHEEWRPDAAQFPAHVLGHELEGWPGERWLDIRRMEVIGPIMKARLDLAAQKGCDGVDPDNVDAYANDIGFPLSAADQVAYNLFLAEEAHSRGLAIGLKNDMDQASALAPHFDWMLNEECFSYDECELLLPFQELGKPIFVIEYELPPQVFCPQAEAMGFNALLKNLELDAYRVDCHAFARGGP
jgi:hypothetical protein